MWQNIKKGFFPTLIAISALSVSASAAFYSVSGLSKLFAGASFEVIIMASSLEVAKLVIASLLYKYWLSLNKILKVYLTIAATVLVLITSMGIYGFLSAAFQETYSELSIVENKKTFIQQKLDFYEKDVQRYDKELESILANINSLSSAKASQIQIKDTSSSTGYRTTVSTTEVRLAQKRIQSEEENRKEVQSKRQVAADSLQKFQLEILELENSSDQASELGPLKYISGLTGTSMDKIINWLLLVIIFVFDPLAISLVVAANFAFEKAFPKKRENLYGELVDDFSEWDNLDNEPNTNNEFEKDGVELTPDPLDLPDIEVKDAEELQTSEEFKEQLDKIENSPNWEILSENNDDFEDAGFDILDLDKDKNFTNEEIELIKNKITHLQSQLQPGISAWRKNKLKREIKYLETKLRGDDDDLVKTY